MKSWFNYGTFPVKQIGKKQVFRLKTKTGVIYKMDIIMEEAGVWFGGDKEAPAVADIIQNCVSMYVKENH